MTSPVVQRIKEFADLRWPDRDIPGRLRKLGEEIGELNEAACRLGMAIAAHTPDSDENEITDCLGKLVLEVADCGIVLQDILILAEVDGDLCECMDAKMEVNERREWPVEET